MQIGSYRSGLGPEAEVWVRGEQLSVTVLKEAVELYKDSGRKIESKEPEDIAFFQTCIHKAFTQILNRKHKGYIRIVSTRGLSLKEEGRIDELFDKHESDPNSLSKTECSFLNNNTMVLLDCVACLPEEEEQSEPDQPEEEMQFEDQALTNAAEEKFRQWLDERRYPWHYFDQSQGTYPAMYRGKIKRPDFSIPTPNGKEFLIDVKARYLKKTWNTVLLDEAEEIRKYQNFLEAWPMYSADQIWFAITLADSDYSEFYWINLDTVLREVEARTSGKSRESFRPIPLSLCTKITWDDDIYKVLISH